MIFVLGLLWCHANVLGFVCCRGGGDKTCATLSEFCMKESKLVTVKSAVVVAIFRFSGKSVAGTE